MTLRPDHTLYPEPALARWLLALATPARERQFLLGDVAEEYAWMIVHGPGPRAARRWYWSQVRGSIAPGIRRLKPLNPGHPQPKTSGFMKMLTRFPTYVTAPAILAVVAMIAVLIPALRASRMNPLEALREE